MTKQIRYVLAFLVTFLVLLIIFTFGYWAGKADGATFSKTTASAQTGFYPIVSMRRARRRMRNYTIDRCKDYAYQVRGGHCVGWGQPKCTRLATANEAQCENHATVIEVNNTHGYWYIDCSGYVWRKLSDGRYRQNFGCTAGWIFNH